MSGIATRKLLSNANEIGSIEMWSEGGLRRDLASTSSGRLDQVAQAGRNLCPSCKRVDKFHRCQPRNLSGDLNFSLAKDGAFMAPIFVTAMFMPSVLH